MNDNNQTLKGYNPLRQHGRKLFNTNNGRKVLTKNASPITDEQKQQAAQRQIDLIEKCYREDLSEN